MRLGVVEKGSEKSKTGIANPPAGKSSMQADYFPQTYEKAAI
jgi:hypothetical protein